MFQRMKLETPSPFLTAGVGHVSTRRHARWRNTSRQWVKHLGAWGREVLNITADAQTNQASAVCPCATRVAMLSRHSGWLQDNGLGMTRRHCECIFHITGRSLLTAEQSESLSQAKRETLSPPQKQLPAVLGHTGAKMARSNEFRMIHPHPCLPNTMHDIKICDLFGSSARQ